MISFYFISGSNSKSFLRDIELRSVSWIFIGRISGQGLCPRQQVPTFMSDARFHAASIPSPRAQGCPCGRAAVKWDFKGGVAPGAPAGARIESAYTPAHLLKLFILSVRSGRDSCFCLPSVLKFTWLWGRKAQLRCMSTAECRDMAFLQVGIHPHPGHGSGHFPGHTMLCPLCWASLGSQENWEGAMRLEGLPWWLRR